jgi:DNA-binding transcriptional LysR family regulator
VPGASYRLTAAGRALLPYARRVLAALEDAQTAVAAVTREARASVDIVANESVSTYLLPEALAVLRQRWPGTRFSVTVATCQAVREGLAQGKYDVGFLLAGAADVREGGLPLADVRLVLFCGAEHPLAPGNGPVPRARLAPFRVFTSDSSGDFHALLHGFFHADGLPGPRLAEMDPLSWARFSFQIWNRPRHAWLQKRNPRRNPSEGDPLF